MKNDTTPSTPKLTAEQQYAVDIAKLNRMLDEIFREVFGPRGNETLQ